MGIKNILSGQHVRKSRGYTLKPPLTDFCVYPAEQLLQIIQCNVTHMSYTKSLLFQLTGFDGAHGGA